MFNRNELIASRVKEKLDQFFLFSTQKQFVNTVKGFCEQFNIQFEPYNFDLEFRSEYNDEGGSYLRIDYCSITNKDGVSLSDLVDDADLGEYEDSRDYWMSEFITSEIYYVEGLDSFNVDGIQDHFDLKGDLLGVLNNEF